MADKVRILFLASDPGDGSQLRLDQEFREIQAKLNSAPKGRGFALSSQWAVRTGDILEALMRHRPHVVHFSGHGSQNGGLILEGNDGKKQPVDGRLLADLLAAFQGTIRLVVLNACYTARVYDVMQSSIDYAVGSVASIGDRDAIRFAGCFYQALAFDHSVTQAFELARRQAALEGGLSADMFSLLVREGVNSALPFAASLKDSGAQDRSRSKNPRPGGAQRADDQATGEQRAAMAVPASGPVPPGKPARRAEVSDDEAKPYSASSRRDAFDVPASLLESLERFRKDHPDPRKVAFLIMRFGKTKAHGEIVASLSKALNPLGIEVVRADDKQYHDDLLPNVLTYAYGCGFGIAIFERLETEHFNPNVALEVGYMFAMQRDVCILKDKTLATLPADLMGKLYRIFDPLDPIGSIPPELERWLQDKGFK